jgi:hypothetical protein
LIGSANEILRNISPYFPAVERRYVEGERYDNYDKCHEGDEQQVVVGMGTQVRLQVEEWVAHSSGHGGVQQPGTARDSKFGYF